ncbi:DUF3152 domain-containing protein [Streptomyces sp. NPDC097619]|uniref:DUF3152 domain-containing protein n=1 Tax=Streptomyces sp. NPDC097619 TaxID=3157228 RepID=UPI003328117B
MGRHSRKGPVPAPEAPAVGAAEAYAPYDLTDLADPADPADPFDPFGPYPGPGPSHGAGPAYGHRYGEGHPAGGTGGVADHLRGEDTGAFAFPPTEVTGTFAAFPQGVDHSVRAQYVGLDETGAHAFPAFTSVEDTGTGPVLSAATGVRGGHPETHEAGGGWGVGPGTRYGDWTGVPRSDTPAFGIPQVRAAAPVPVAVPPVPGPRRAPEPTAPARPRPAADGAHPAPPGGGTAAEPADRPGRGRKIRTYTGMAAAVLTTALAVGVAVQVTGEEEGSRPSAARDGDPDRARDAAASRSDQRPSAPAVGAPSASPAAPAQTYEQKMAARLALDPALAGSGEFATVQGVAKAPGKGRLVRYRVDVEKGLPLDPALFAEAVQRTLNDKRSWAHDGEMTFERVPGGETGFVITLASPVTTGKWCAKSDLDTTVDNVSCDSASTERVMINAYRWAQGSVTFGPDKMFAYRQMLINHEVGHRLGHGHVSCRTPGALAPVMQQQTKSLNLEGISCKPNPWVYPGN